MNPTKRALSATLVALFGLGAQSQALASTWVRNVVPGPKAIYIGVDGYFDGSTPSILDPYGNLYQFDGISTWSPITGHTGTTLAVEYNGFMWITDTSGQIWHWEYGWDNRSYGQCASWIGASAIDHAWAIGCSWLGNGGFGIYNLVNNAAWIPQVGQAVQVSVSVFDNTPWVINAQNHVFVRNGSSWKDVTGTLPNACAQSIAALSSTRAYVVSCSGAPTGNGYFVYKYANGAWHKIGNSSDVYISVGGSTDIVPWSVDGVGTIYHWTCPTFNGC
jgi:hypothetical protein